MALGSQSLFGSIDLIIVIIVVIIAVILALIYRLGYLNIGKRGSKSDSKKTRTNTNEGFTSQPQTINRPPSPLVPREVPQPGGRSLLVESKPMEARPLQTQQSVDIERIEKLIRGLESTLVQVLKQTSADTADMVLSKMNELKNVIEELASQCSSQAPPFTQYGYIPGNLADFRDLFKAKYVGLAKDNDILEYVGEPPSGDVLSTLMGTSGDLFMYTVGEEYLYVVKYNNLRLIVRVSDYLDPLSIELLKMLYRRFIDEVFRPSSRLM